MSQTLLPVHGDHIGSVSPSKAARRLFRGPIIAGLAILILFFAGFGGWAAYAPLDDAAIANGSVVVDTRRKTIQHLEGGIVSEILVHDGDHVTAGQVLVKLDSTQQQSALAVVRGRYQTALADVARFKAEQLDQSQIDFPPELLAHLSEPEVAKLIDAENKIFAAHRDEIESQIKILRERDGQSEQEIVGLQGQIKAEQEQIALITEEASTVGEMLAKGLAQKPRLLALQRSRAEIEGAMSQNVAAIARARQSIDETQLRISQLQVSRVDDATKGYGEALKETFEFSDRLRTAEDVLARTEIRSPTDGIVVNEGIHTPGGVISPGMALMEIVPTADRLVIEARVEVNDIERVHAGLPAQVRLITYNQRNTPSLRGTVEWVSADRIDDDKLKESFYNSRIVADPADLAQMSKIGVRLLAGMRVEVMIVAERRTALDYFLAPFNRTFARALHEY